MDFQHGLSLLCRVAAVLVAGDEGLIRAAFQQALDANVSSSELREVILTSYLFDGYPTALEGFRILSEMLAPLGAERGEFEYSPENVTLWRRRGEPLCRQIYGAQYAALVARVEKIAPELADAMLVEGYGKVLARDSLSIQLRELCIVSILAAKSKPRQLLSHALGALRLGATPAQLQSALKAASEYAPTVNIERAGLVIEEAIDKYKLP